MHAALQELATVMSHGNLRRRDAHLAVAAEDKDPSRTRLYYQNKLLHCACTMLAGSLGTPPD